MGVSVVCLQFEVEEEKRRKKKEEGGVGEKRGGEKRSVLCKGNE